MDNPFEQGEMFSMLGNLPFGSFPFRVGDKVRFENRHTWDNTKPSIIKEIKEGRDGYIEVEGSNHKAYFKEMLDGCFIKKIN